MVSKGGIAAPDASRSLSTAYGAPSQRGSITGRPALAPDHQVALVYRDLDVLLPQAWQLRLDDQVAVLLVDVGAGRPGPGGQDKAVPRERHRMGRQFQLSYISE